MQVIKGIHEVLPVPSDPEAPELQQMMGHVPATHIAAALLPGVQSQWEADIPSVHPFPAYIPMVQLDPEHKAGEPPAQHRLSVPLTEYPGPQSAKLKHPCRHEPDDPVPQ
jgi:hypothetical protein